MFSNEITHPIKKYLNLEHMSRIANVTMFLSRTCTMIAASTGTRTKIYVVPGKSNMFINHVPRLRVIPLIQSTYGRILWTALLIKSFPIYDRLK